MPAPGPRTRWAHSKAASPATRPTPRWALRRAAPVEQGAPELVDRYLQLPADLPERDIDSLVAAVHPGFWPDLTVLLDAPVDTGLARAHERNGTDGPDRFETERREFFERVRETYLLRSSREPQRIPVVEPPGCEPTFNPPPVRARS